MQAFNDARKHFEKYVDVLWGSMKGGEITNGEFNFLEKLIFSDYYFEIAYTYDKPHPTDPTLKRIA